MRNRHLNEVQQTKNVIDNNRLVKYVRGAMDFSVT